MNYLCVVNYCFWDHFGGAPRVAWDVCKLMKDRGHNVVMFCQKWKPQDDDIAEYDGIKVVRFLMPKTFSLDPFKLKKYQKAAESIYKKYLGQTKWDIVHSHVPIEGKIVSDIIGKNTKYIYTVHSPVLMEQQFIWSTQGIVGKIKRVIAGRALNNIEENILQISSKIHVLSNFTKENILRLHNIKSEKINIIPSWCKEDLIRIKTKEQARTLLNWDKNKKIIFTIRGMRERYGLDIAIKSIVPILKSRNDLIFVIAGDGPLREQLENIARESGVSDKIIFMGRVSDDQLKNCYEAADLFILPTKAMECFGLIVLEAYAYGLPIISTDAGALPELIKPIAPDMIVPAGQIEPLREKIEQYLNNCLNVPTSEEIIQYCQNNYSKEIITKKLIDLIEN